MQAARLVSFLLAIVLLPSIGQTQERRTFPLDTAASTLKWTGHAEVGTYAPSGSLSIRAGEVIFQGSTFSGANLIVDMNSMTQDNKDLLHHLKSADFFDVEHFPTATIHVDRIANGTVFGSMTVKGKTAPFDSPVKLTQANHRFVIAGNVTLDRTRYGILYNSSSFFSGLGNQAIRNTFQVEFSLCGAGDLPSP